MNICETVSRSGRADIRVGYRLSSDRFLVLWAWHWRRGMSSHSVRMRCVHGVAGTFTQLPCLLLSYATLVQTGFQSFYCCKVRVVQSC